MLLELKVKGFATIDSLKVHFLRPGLNVLTGETGAGKSIILKSLGLLISGKATPDVIRTGHDEATIEGAFDLHFRSDVIKELKELDLDSGDNSFVVRRILSRTGRNRIYINGHLSTLNVLTELVGKLIEITGQHEYHTLTDPSSQLRLLDRFANSLKEREAVTNGFHSLSNLRGELQQIESDSAHRQQRVDFLNFQIQEIDNLKPIPGEDQSLQQSCQRIKGITKLQAYSEKAVEKLYNQDGSVHSQLLDLVREGEALAELDPTLKPLLRSLKESSVLIEDSAFGFRDYNQRAGSAEDLDKLEDRLSQLKKLQKKYGATVEDILNFREKAEQELGLLASSDERVEKIREQIANLEVGLLKSASELSLKRKKAGKKLQSQVQSELEDLNMKGVEFIVQLNSLKALSSEGMDEIRFMFKNSSLDEARSISKVASGGELSRLMLSLKQVIAASEFPMTYLFDEVDNGVSGPTGEKVGQKLKRIGRVHQVICITHLPQVASFADAHFLITKETLKNEVRSDVQELKTEERIKELGRLISGKKITASSLAHAKEMIQSSARLN